MIKDQGKGLGDVGANQPEKLGLELPACGNEFENLAANLRLTPALRAPA